MTLDPLGVKVTPTTFHFTVQPGDVIFLGVSDTHQQTWFPALNGHLLVGAPFLRERYFVGVAGATGVLDWDLVLPAQAPLGLSTWHFQAYFAGPLPGGNALGPIRTISILDSAW